MRLRFEALDVDRRYLQTLVHHYEYLFPDDGVDNLQVACRSCNGVKSGRYEDDRRLTELAGYAEQVRWGLGASAISEYRAFCEFWKAAGVSDDYELQVWRADRDQVAVAGRFFEWRNLVRLCGGNLAVVDALR